jgi:hypothetical protein
MEILFAETGRMAIAAVCTDSGKTPLLSSTCHMPIFYKLWSISKIISVLRMRRMLIIESGNTSAHCGAGCQSGNCLSAPAVPAPGPVAARAAPNGGSFNIVGLSGVPAMHAALMPNGRVMFLDK